MGIARFLVATLAGTLIKAVIDMVQVALAGTVVGVVLSRGRQAWPHHPPSLYVHADHRQ